MKEFNVIRNLRLILLVISIFPAIIKTSGQVDTSFRYYFYDQRYSLFEHLPVREGCIIMLGNSITNGANWAEIFNNPQVLNRGISGDNTFGVLHRLHQITAARPSKLFIMIGINDLAKETPVEVILSNFRKIVNRIKKDTPETQIFLQSILPTNNLFDDFKKHQNKDKDIKAVNTGLEELARDVNVSFIDLYPHFLDSAGRLSADYTNDGLHLTGSGYMLWADLIRDLIEN